MTNRGTVKLALWKHPVHFLAYGLGSGLVPLAPGTMGTLVAVPLFWLMAPLSAGYYAATIGVLAWVSWRTMSWPAPTRWPCRTSRAGPFSASRRE